MVSFCKQAQVEKQMIIVGGIRAWVTFSQNYFFSSFQIEDQWVHIVLSTRLDWKKFNIWLNIDILRCNTRHFMQECETFGSSSNIKNSFGVDSQFIAPKIA